MTQENDGVIWASPSCPPQWSTAGRASEPAVPAVIRDEYSGVTFEPWTDGRAVGFKVTRLDPPTVRYVYLNPSLADPAGQKRHEGIGDIFIYQGHGDVAEDVPVAFVDPFNDETPERDPS